MSLNYQKDPTAQYPTLATGLDGIDSVVRFWSNGTEEVKNLLKNECTVIYECSYCRSLFRSIINFLSHKRTICRSLQTSIRMETELAKQVNDALLGGEKDTETDAGSAESSAYNKSKKNPASLRRVNLTSALGKHIHTYNVPLEHTKQTIEVQTLPKISRSVPVTSIVNGRQIVEDIPKNLAIKERLPDDRTVLVMPRDHSIRYGDMQLRKRRGADAEVDSREISQQDIEIIEKIPSQLHDVVDFQALRCVAPKCWGIQPFISVSVLAHHLAIHHQDTQGKLSCFICGTQFSSIRILQKHFKSTHINVLKEHEEQRKILADIDPKGESQRSGRKAQRGSKASPSESRSRYRSLSPSSPSEDGDSVKTEDRSVTPTVPPKRASNPKAAEKAKVQENKEAAKSQQIHKSTSQPTLNANRSRRKTLISVEQLKKLNDEIAEAKKSGKANKDKNKQETPVIEPFFDSAETIKDGIISFDEARKIDEGMYEVQMVPYFSYFSVVVLAYHYVMADNKRQEVEKHMEMGKMFLSKGQFSDALQHYHAAAELDPSDYQIFYRRATVLLAQGKMKAALPDLHRVVELKPDFIAGRVQRGNILFKQGQLSDSAEDFRFAVKHEPEHADAKDKLEKISQVQEWIDTATDYFENDDFHSAEKYFDQVIEHVHWDADLHRKRSKCRLARGDVHNALADIRAVAKLVPDSTEIYLEMAEMYYGVGDVENSLMQIRECLKLNPDHKLCFPFYKKIKKLAKMREALEKAAKAEQWADCLKKGEEILKLEKKIDGIQYDVFRHTCKCNMKLQHIAEAVQQCSTALKYGDENDLDLLLDRGEAYLLDEQYDKAIEDFQQAAKAHDDSRRAKEALNRAQKLAKQAKKKDYYKILGLRRNADKRDVMKAYRKLAQKWHPDNFQDDDEKKRAQDKFIDIANAKDVLTDPEKRQRYDNGEDPLDPESQHGAHHGWHQQWGDMPFGSHFGGGQQGYSFKFNFG